MSGVYRERSRWRIRVAVSNPSMSGMRTSSKISAKSRRKRQRRASAPDLAVTISRPGPASSASMAMSDFTSSSTMRMLAMESLLMSRSGAFLLAEEPDAQQRKQLIGVHRLGNIIRCAGFETFLAVAFHGFCRQGEYRQEPVQAVTPDFADGFIAVHLRHHDVHQHSIDDFLLVELA